MTENSRWDLPDDDVGRYIDALVRLHHRPAARGWIASEPFQLDPSGDDALRMAKQVRQRVLRDGGEERSCAEAAERHFGMPATRAAAIARELAQPLYDPGARRQQLIDALRVGAALRLLHDVSDEHALQLLLAGDEALCFRGMLGDTSSIHAASATSSLTLSEPFAFGDLRRRIARSSTIAAKICFAAVWLTTPSRTRSSSCGEIGGANA